MIFRAARVLVPSFLCMGADVAEMKARTRDLVQLDPDELGPPMQGAQTRDSYGRALLRRWEAGRKLGGAAAGEVAAGGAAAGVRGSAGGAGRRGAGRAGAGRAGYPDAFWDGYGPGAAKAEYTFATAPSAATGRAKAPEEHERARVGGR